VHRIQSFIVSVVSDNGNLRPSAQWKKLLAVDLSWIFTAWCYA